MESGIVYPKDSCAVCGLVYRTNWRPDFTPRSASDRMILLVVDSTNAQETSAFSTFLMAMQTRGFVSRHMCSHSWEVRFRGTEIELSSIDHVIGVLRLSDEIDWVAQFRFALRNPTSVVAKTG